METGITITIRLMLLLSLMGIIALWTVGCNTISSGNAPYGVAARAQLEFGEGAGTRNKTPQGGTYEKSGSTPTQPAVQ